LKDLSIDCTQIRASGGFTQSPLWLQIIASVLDRELTLPSTGETSSLGAALWAMLGEGVVSSLEDIHSLIPIAESYPASQEQVRIYRRIYPLYRELYQVVSPYFDDLADLSPKG
jgi:gluconokinase